MAKKRAKRRRGASVLELPVTYGNVSIGDETARLTVNVSRAHLDVREADRNFCCRLLAARLEAFPNGQQADQPTFPGVEADQAVIEAPFTCHAFRAGGKTISFGATFNLSAVDISVLAHFSKREGRIMIHSVEELPEEHAQDEEELVEASQPDLPRKSR